MRDLQTSYIFTRPEMLFLLRSIADAEPSPPMRRLIDRYLSGHAAAQDAVEGLAFKKLITLSPGRIALEPVVDLLVRSALSADAIWMLGGGRVFILRSPRLFLLARRYPLIPGAWKVTPHEDARALAERLLDEPVGRVTLIDANENQRQIDPQGQFAWLEE